VRWARSKCAAQFTRSYALIALLLSSSNFPKCAHTRLQLCMYAHRRTHPSIALAIINTHLDGRAGVEHALASHQSIGGVHGDGAHGVVAGVLADLQDELAGVILHLQGGQDGGQAVVEAHIHNRSNHLYSSRTQAEGECECVDGQAWGEHAQASAEMQMRSARMHECCSRCKRIPHSSKHTHTWLM